MSALLKPMKEVGAANRAYVSGGRRGTHSAGRRERRTFTIFVQGHGGESGT